MSVRHTRIRTQGSPPPASEDPWPYSRTSGCGGWILSIVLRVELDLVKSMEWCRINERCRRWRRVALCFLLVHLSSGMCKSLWLPLIRISRRDVRISRGGQEIVRVTLLVNLRDDSIQCGQDSPLSPCLIFIIVDTGSGLDFTAVL